MPTVVHSVSINEEGSLFVACLNSGLRILNMEPLVTKRTLDSTVTGRISGVRLCSLLHRTNLIALVNGNSPDDSLEEVDRTVLIWDDAQRRFVLEFTFASRVLALRTTRDRLFVVERTRIHAFSYPSSPVRRLFTVETRDNGKGLCAVTPLTAASALQLLAFPGHKVGSVQLLDLSIFGKSGSGFSTTIPNSTSMPSSQSAGINNGSKNNCDCVNGKNNVKSNSSSKNKSLLDSDSDDDDDNDERWERGFLDRIEHQSNAYESEAEEGEKKNVKSNNLAIHKKTTFDEQNHYHSQQQQPQKSYPPAASVSISPTTLSAHQTEVACLALNRRGTLLATASQKGTLIRVFRTSSVESHTHLAASNSTSYTPLSPVLLTELRRGLDVATLYCIAFSADDAFLLASSDKGTVHIFALKEGGRLNRRSSLYSVVPLSQQLTALAGVTGAAAYSLAKFTLPAECACVATFGAGGSNSGGSGGISGSVARRSVYAVCVDGSYHKYLFAEDGSGDCQREVYDHYLEAPDEEEIILL